MPTGRLGGAAVPTITGSKLSCATSASFPFAASWTLVRSTPAHFSQSYRRPESCSLGAPRSKHKLIIIHRHNSSRSASNAVANAVPQSKTCQSHSSTVPPRRHITTKPAAINEWPLPQKSLSVRVSSTYRLILRVDFGRVGRVGVADQQRVLRGQQSAIKTHKIMNEKMNTNVRVTARTTEKNHDG